MESSLAESDAVATLAALAQPMRLRVFRALVGAGPEGQTPSALAGVLGVAASTLSFHLKALQHAGLVTVERDSRWLIYRAEFPRMQALLDYLTAHCCHGQPCDALPAAATGPACCPATAPTALQNPGPAAFPKEPR